MVLLVALSSTQARAQAPSVTTTTTYTYDTVSLLPKTVTTTSDDGGYQQTATTYAHEASLFMEQMNMLTQVARTAVRGPGGVDLACQRTTWRGHGGGVVPDRVYEGCGGEEVERAYFEAYNARGQVTLVKEQAGAHGEWLSTQVGYDGAGRPTSVAQSGYYLHTPVTRAFRYDARGRLDRITDENGQHTSFDYDGLGRLVRTRNHAGDVLSEHAYAYSRALQGNGGAYSGVRPNHVQTTVYGSPNGRTTTYLDGLGRPFLSAEAKGGTPVVASLTEYDASGRPHRAWLPASLSLSSTSTATVTLADQVKTQAQTEYAAAQGNGSGALNRPFTETAYEASPLARPARTREAGAADEGAAMRYGVERATALLPVSGCSGVWCGRAEGAAPPMAYAETEDADGMKTRTYTDGLGRTRFVRAGVGSADEALTEMVYDAAGRLTEVRSPLYFRPRAGQSGSRTSHRTTYAYDTRGQLTHTTSPDAGTTRMAYAPSGLLRYRQDADQATRGEIAYFFYDELGREMSMGIGRTTCTWAQATGGVATCNQVGTARRFDSGELGHNLVRSSIWGDPSQNYWGNPAQAEGWPFFVPAAFAFTNVKGRLAATAYKSDGAWQSEAYAYDAAGNLGRKRTWTEGVTNGVAEFAYTHDRQGRRTGMTVTVGSHAFRENYTYNALGQVATYGADQSFPSSAYYPAPTLASYTYTSAGQPLQRALSTSAVSSPGGGTAGTQAWAYDVRGRLTRIGPTSPIANETRPVWTGGTYPSGGAAYAYAMALAYTPGGRVRSWYSDAPYSALAAGGRDATAGARHWSFDQVAYDGLGRLASATYSGTSTGAYAVPLATYDAAGNVLRLQRRAPKGVGQGSALIDDLTYTYPAASNRLGNVAEGAQASTWAHEAWDAEKASLGYQAHGLMSAMYAYPRSINGTERQETTLTQRYDEEGRPLYEQTSRWHEGSGQYVSGNHYSRYGVGGWRIWRDAAGQRRHYVREGARVIGEFDGSGNLARWNLAGGPEGLLGRFEPGASGGGRRFYVSDHLGSVRGAFDGDGRTVEARDYYPYGAEMPGRVWVQGMRAREGFTGHEFDGDTGQYYAGARTYHPALARWLSVDPLSDVMPGMSPYGYAYDDPFRWTDPTGKIPCSQHSDPFMRTLPGTCANGVAVVEARRDFERGFHRATQSVVVDLADLLSGYGDAVEAIKNIQGYRDQLRHDIDRGDYDAALCSAHAELSALGDILGFTETASGGAALLTSSTGVGGFALGTVSVGANFAALTSDIGNTLIEGAQVVRGDRGFGNFLVNGILSAGSAYTPGGRANSRARRLVRNGVSNAASDLRLPFAQSLFKDPCAKPRPRQP